jgi:hypothetical protein
MYFFFFALLPFRFHIILNMPEKYNLIPNGKWLLHIFWICCLMFGCMGKHIPYETVRYINQDILNLSHLEANALKSYASVTGANYTTDERVYEALRDTVVPYYKRFTELLRVISPESGELNRIHSLYVNGAEKMYNGFKAKMMGIEKKDENLIRIANQQIETGRDETLLWRSELGRFLEKSAVTVKK